MQMRQAVGEAEQTCGGLQKTASELEGRLAELAHWNTEAMEICQHLRELQHRGQHGSHPKTKVRIKHILVPIYTFIIRSL